MRVIFPFQDAAEARGKAALPKFRFPRGVAFPPFPVYVISLANATRRRELVQQQLNARGIAFRYFDAVDGTHMLPADEVGCARQGTHAQEGRHNPLCAVLPAAAVPRQQGACGCLADVSQCSTWGRRDSQPPLSPEVRCLTAPSAAQQPPLTAYVTGPRLLCTDPACRRCGTQAGPGARASTARQAATGTATSPTTSATSG